MMQHDAGMGQDSFLDIVANLVGILIILVVVVGAQAASSWQAVQPSQTQLVEADKIKRALDKEFEHALNLQRENGELHRKLDYEQSLSKRLSANRHALLMQMSEAKVLLDSRKQDMDEHLVESHRLRAEVEQLKQQIQQVRYEFAAVDHHSAVVAKTIEHYPTPIAKTVFSDEIHFQIKGGKIAYVPMDELITAMRNEWKVKAKKLNSAENTWESVGPIENFRMQYLLKVVSNTVGPPSTYGIQFQRFEIQSLSSIIGEEIENALQSDSDFRRRLSRLIPQKTTVSLWVYPTDYQQFVEIRDWLRQNQFQIASWPLKEGQLISGGPSGFRTSTN